MLSMMPSKRHRIRGPHRSHSLHITNIREDDGGHREGYLLEDFSSGRFSWVEDLEQF